jgi:hypothetical protein
MAQRDYEEQPEAPDLGASIQLESSQHLAAPPGDRDGMEAGYVPPDRPYVLEDNSMTARGMRRGDTLDERLAREEPEGEPGGDPDRAGRIAIADEGIALETPDSLAGVDVGIDGGAASAEEAAVHLIDGNSALDGEPSVAADPALADPEVDALLAGEGEDDGGAVDKARADAARDVTGILDADRS